MEPFLKDLRKRVLKNHKAEQNVVVYPVTEGRKDVAIYQINKRKQCRISYYDVTDGGKCSRTREYTFTGKCIERYMPCAADNYEVVAYNDNDISRLLIATIFNNFTNYRGWWAEERIDGVLKHYERNPRLIMNLVDSGLVRSPYELNCVPNTDKTSIKEVFGVSPKYLRISGLNYAEAARVCWENNLSPKETQVLFKKLSGWDIVGDTFTKQQLKYIAQHEVSHVWAYRDYCSMRKFLISEGIDVSSFPECPLDSSDVHIEKLHNAILPVHGRARQVANKRSLQEKTDRYLRMHYPKAKEFDYANDKYTIFACKDLSDLVREGSELHHCVGSYVDSVGDGREYILFLRKNDDLEKPFFTIDVLPDKTVRQIHGMCNCNVPNELMPFVKKWAKEYELNITSINGVRCHI